MSFIINLLKTRFVTSTGLALICTGSYVSYKDYRRYPRMMDTFSRGSILPPLDCEKYQVQYFPRGDLEKRIKEVLNPVFSNEYYLIKGEVGTGKSRLMMEVCKQLIESRGESQEGAPIYVNVSQGKSLIDSLARSVNFLFDEHINFRFFLDFILRINAIPAKEDDHKLSRLLDAIEEAAHIYTQKKGRPVVLVIDSVDMLAKHMPASLEKIQGKAKFWADTNIVKLILVTNDEETELILQKNQSNWSRAEAPIFVDDLSREEAITFLRSDLTGGIFNGQRPAQIGETEAEQMYDLVGGRVQYLMIFKRDFIDCVPFELTTERLKRKEREKFLGVSNAEQAIKALTAVGKSKDKQLYMSQLLDIVSTNDVNRLARKNIVKIRRTTSGTKILLESRLTEHVVFEYMSAKK